MTTIAGVLFLLAIVKHSPSAWAFAPGLLLIGLGLGVMLTPSVNIVQSAFPEQRQGEISGLSRSVSNLGSSLGTAIAGTILVSGLTTPTKSYALAMIAVAIIGFVGLGATVFIRKQDPAQEAASIYSKRSTTTSLERRTTWLRIESLGTTDGRNAREAWGTAHLIRVL